MHGRRERRAQRPAGVPPRAHRGSRDPSPPVRRGDHHHRPGEDGDRLGDRHRRTGPRSAATRPTATTRTTPREADVLVEAEDTTFNPVVPSRQFDTRDGTGGAPVGKVPGGTALEFTVTGVNGIPVGASAVALNVTIANPEADGYASVYPCATPPGPASNLNFVAEQTVANAVIAPVDPTGKVCFFTTADHQHHLRRLGVVPADRADDLHAGA